MFSQVLRGVGKYKSRIWHEVLLFACKLCFKRTVILTSACFMLLYGIGDCKAARVLRQPFLFVLEMKTNNETMQWKVSWISGSSCFTRTWREKPVNTVSAVSGEVREGYCWVEVSICQDTYHSDTLGSQAVKERKMLRHSTTVAEE